MAPSNLFCGYVMVYYVVIMFVILIYNGGISIQSVTIVLFGYAYLTGCKGAITSDALAAAAVAPFADVLFKILWRSFSYPS